MFFTWLKHRKRRRLLAQPFPDEWANILEHNVHHYRHMNADERQKLQRLVQVFVGEKYWEGCNGLTITTEIQVTVAGHACLLLLGFDGEAFDRLQTVLVYPDAYVAQDIQQGPGGVETQSAVPRYGETRYAGPIVLSWKEVQAAGRDVDGRQNLVLHEFAHYLDMQSYEFNGTPDLQDSGLMRTWHEVMTAEYHNLVRDVEYGQATLLDYYGATNPAEFFAVATECFFEQPQQLADQHGQLYDVLRNFYQQDPAVRNV